jgi:hypothetical protein
VQSLGETEKVNLRDKVETIRTVFHLFILLLLYMYGGIRRGATVNRRNGSAGGWRQAVHHNGGCRPGQAIGLTVDGYQSGQVITNMFCNISFSTYCHIE